MICLDNNSSIKLNDLRGKEMKKKFVFIVLALVLITLTACTTSSKNPKTELGKSDTQIQFTLPGPNPELNKKAEGRVVSGLFTGLWHGLISPVTLFISFFSPEIQMYDVFNTGPLYNLGFLLGVAIVFAILGFSGGRRRKR